VDTADKIVKALTHSLKVDYVRLNSDGGITGFVVSPDFEDMTSLGRQERIESALNDSPTPLTPQENRQVLMIAGITPVEYDSVGARIRVHRVKEMAGGTIQVMLHGSLADAEYVRGALNSVKGVQTTEPEPVPGLEGIMTSFIASSTVSDPLTKAAAIRILKVDHYIEVVDDA